MISPVDSKYSMRQYGGVCAILLTLSMGIGWIAFQMRAKTVAILDRGVLTQGTADSQFHGKSSGTWYQFDANGVRYGGSTHNLYAPGVPITVRYVPDNPKDNAEEGTLSRSGADQLAWGSLAAGPIYCGIAGIIFLSRRRRGS